MAEPLSPLAHLPAVEGGGSVVLGEASARSILRIQTWPDTLGAVHKTFTGLLGMEAPAVGRAAVGNGVTLFTASPGVFIVAGLATDMVWLIESGLSAPDAAITDLSHGRTILILEGRRAAGVLQKCVMIDLDLRAFPPDRVAETAIHHVGVLIHRRSEISFAIMAPRSFASALVEWLLDAGLEEGIGFRR